MEAKDRLIRDGSKSLEMLLSDYNTLKEDNKEMQDRLKVIKEELCSTKLQLDSATE